MIYEAWADEPWTVEGAAVRVSLVCFAAEAPGVVRLDGVPVPAIHSDLTAGGADLTKARRLAGNRGVAFMGDTKGGAFDVPGDLARSWMTLPSNPNGRPNADVLRPWANGMDVTRRPSDTWIVDFGTTMSEAEAAFYAVPFAHVSEHVRPARTMNKRDAYARNWWRHVEARPAMSAALAKLPRFIITPRVAKHRLFAWMRPPTLPDCQLIAVARDDDVTFGILHSRMHELWALRMGSALEDRPRYTPSTTFETFPFPAGLTPDRPAAAYAGDPRAVAITAATRAGRSAGPLVEPARVGAARARGGAGLPRTLATPRRDGSRYASRSHADEPLQSTWHPARSLAGQPAPCLGRSCGHRLWLAGGLDRHRDTITTVDIKSCTIT